MPNKANDDHLPGKNFRWELPRRRASSDIKLLRLELYPKGVSPSDGIGVEWSPAQPTESLSPSAAARALGIEEWAPVSVVKARFRTLQLRYPPEQYSSKHLEWRPSSELLSNSRARLNWYWQSGLIPQFFTNETPERSPLWNTSTIEPPMNPTVLFSLLCELEDQP
jgi:hypothetical protein